MTEPSRRGVHRFLESEGFTLSAPHKGTKTTYKGSLPFRGRTIAVCLDIVDWDFKQRPEVRLIERPPELAGFRPHLGVGSSLCYLDRESVYMDRYDPVRVIGRCLVEAEKTLEDIAGDKRRIDVHGEFLANWRSKVQFPMMLWEHGEIGKRALSALNVDFPHQAGLCVVTDAIEKTSSCLSSTGAKTHDTFVECVVEFTTEKVPAIDPDQWPPTRLRDVLNWLEAWDPLLRRAFWGRLESMWSKDKVLLAVIFCTPSGRFGFDFTITYKDAAEKKRLAKHSSDRRQRIFNQNPSIRRFTVSDLSPTYVHGRNQPRRETLAGKHIAVVGCGTVGGYLATFLARLGAGFDGGSLKLYDTQLLHPENLGRHVLSMRDLYRNKAEGVVDLLSVEFGTVAHSQNSQHLLFFGVQ